MMLNVHYHRHQVPGVGKCQTKKVCLRLAELALAVSEANAKLARVYNLMYLITLAHVTTLLSR